MDLVFMRTQIMDLVLAFETPLGRRMVLIVSLDLVWASGVQSWLGLYLGKIVQCFFLH